MNTKFGVVISGANRKRGVIREGHSVNLKALVNMLFLHFISAYLHIRTGLTDRYIVVLQSLFFLYFGVQYAP